MRGKCGATQGRSEVRTRSSSSVQRTYRLSSSNNDSFAVVIADPGCTAPAGAQRSVSPARRKKRRRRAFDGSDSGALMDRILPRDRWRERDGEPEGLTTEEAA